MTPQITAASGTSRTMNVKGVGALESPAESLKQLGSYRHFHRVTVTVYS